jgi:hypothetical protein
MRIRCINIDNLPYNHLTLGTIYEVICVNDDPPRKIASYTVINNQNTNGTYYADRFMDIEKNRNNKLDQLLFT